MPSVCGEWRVLGLVNCTDQIERPSICSKREIRVVGKSAPVNFSAFLSILVFNKTFSLYIYDDMMWLVYGNAVFFDTK